MYVRACALDYRCGMCVYTVCECVCVCVVDTCIGEPSDLEEEVVLRAALRQHEEGSRGGTLQVPHQGSTELPIVPLQHHLHLHASTNTATHFI